MAQKNLEKQIRAACKSFEVDWKHARHVADLSRKLFEATRHINGLTKTAGPAVEAGALLQEVASEASQADLPDLEDVLEKVELPPCYRQIACEAVRLAHPQTEVSATIRSMSDETHSVEREAAVRLAAVLRVAAGLDHSRSQTTDIRGVYDSGREIRVLTGGDASAEDAASAQARANLWNDLLARPVQVVCSTSVSASYIPVIDPREPMCDAARRILQLHAEQLWSRQYGAGWDLDEEFVHEMRVASRRIRTALGLAAGALGPQADYWAKEFSWLGDVLGGVRDLDVLLEFLEDYIEEAPKTHRKALVDLMDYQLRRRRSAKRKLLKAMESPRYEKLRQGFGRAVTHSVGSLEGLQGVGDRAQEPFGPEARRLCAARLDELARCPRDLASLDSEPLHQVRLACKKLRYSIEFFRDVLPDEAGKIANEASKLQDRLGQVHDADVWMGQVDAYRSKTSPDAAGLRACKALCKFLADRRSQWLEKACKAWKRFSGPTCMERKYEALRHPRN